MHKFFFRENHNGRSLHIIISALPSKVDELIFALLHLTNSSRILTAQRFVDLTPLKSVQAGSNNCNIVHISRGDKNLVGSEQVCLGVISSKTLLLAVKFSPRKPFGSSG